MAATDDAAIVCYPSLSGMRSQVGDGVLDWGYFLGTFAFLAANDLCVSKLDRACQYMTRFQTSISVSSGTGQSPGSAFQTAMPNLWLTPLREGMHAMPPQPPVFGMGTR